MKKISLFVLICIAVFGLMFMPTSSADASSADVSKTAPAVRAVNNGDVSVKNRVTEAVRADLNFGRFPLYFIANRGQVNEKAGFYAKTPKYTLWLTKEGLVFDSIRREYRENNKPGRRNLRGIATRSVTKLMFVGADKKAEMVALDPAKLRINYFKGQDRSKWQTGIPTSMAVLYKNLYKNIDLKVYGIERQIEYDWIVKPGGSPADIKVEYKNVKSTRIDKAGNIVIDTKFGELIHKKPVAFQLLKEVREQVEVSFTKTGKNSYGFTLGHYDKIRELIIDPVVLAYSSYLGGSAADKGYAIGVDNSNRVYVVGETDSTNFPTLDEYMADPGDSSADVFISKIDTNQSGASSLIYSTYLGGDGDDSGHGIFVRGDQNVFVTGATESTDFPLWGQYQGNQTGGDGFVTQIDTRISGSLGLIYSTYLGGSGVTEGGEDIAVEGGIIYVTGSTDSTNFPTSADPWQAAIGGANDVFVTKLNPTLGASGLLFSTYLGGSGDDFGTGIKADNADICYVTGYTSSTDFPAPGSAYQAVSGGGNDAFVTRLWTAPGTGQGAFTLQYSTYLGGSGDDFGTGIALDELLNVSVTGYTSSTNFPTLNQYQTHQGGSDAFVTKINTLASGAFGLLYSTYVGGSGSDFGYGISFDSPTSVFITGITQSTNFPTLNEYQGDQSGDDAFVTKIDTAQAGTAGLIYSTYLGGAGVDNGMGIATRGHVAYVTGHTYSTNFPTENEYQSTLTGGSDAFVAKLVSGSITVITPNGGEEWGPGSIQNIEWDAIGLGGAVSISLFKDGSPVGVIVDAVEANASPHTWTVGEYIGGTAAPGTGYTISVDEIGTTVSDGSDAAFSISELNLTAPNGYENWSLGSTQNITWDAPGMTGTMQITLWQSAASVGVIADGLDPAAGSYPWTVGDYIGGTVAPGAGFTVKVEETGSAVSDESDDSFFISDTAVIRITSPNGGEAWTPGTEQNITWDPGTLTGSVIIGLFKDGIGVGVIVNGYETALGSYPWTVGEYVGGTAPSGTGYTLKIVVKGTTIFDKSDGSFEILPGIFEVTSPNGGESWPAGTTQNITWDASGFSGNLHIGLLKGSALLGVIARNIDSATGSYTWTVGQYIGGTAPVDSDYRVGIRLKGTTTKDISDATFEIATAPQPITVLSPNGGEDWEIGSAQTITWTAPGATGLLRITLLKDGVTLGTIANNVDPTLGSIIWRAGSYSGGTAVAGTGYRIKIKQKLVTISDVSDAPFALSDPAE